MSMTNYCNLPGNVIYKRVLQSIVYGKANYLNYRYTFSTQSFDTYTTISPDATLAFTVPVGEIIDVYNYVQGNGQIIIETLYFNGNPAVDIFEYGIISGNGLQVLLKSEIDTSGSIPLFKTWIFDVSTQTVTMFETESTLVCNPGFSYSTSTPLIALCVSTTRNTYYHDGNGGVTISSVANSTICGYVAPVPDVDITEEKIVKINYDCPENPVMLIWKNTLGGWDQWLFKKDQTKNSIVSSVGIVGLPVWSLSSAQATNQEIGKTRTNKMILGADNLSKSEVNGIQEILISPAVYMIDQSYNKTKVTVSPGTFLIEQTYETLQTLEFEIVLPDTLTIRN